MDKVLLSDEEMLRALHPYFQMIWPNGPAPPFEETELTSEDIGIGNRAIAKAQLQKVVEDLRRRAIKFLPEYVTTYHNLNKIADEWEDINGNK